MKKNKIKYICSEEFKTNINKPTKKQLADIFNRKMFKLIMRIEKRNYNA